MTAGRTAGYAATIHPDQLEQIEAQIRQGAHRAGHRHRPRAVGGAQLPVCTVCGAVVHDDLLHGTWHDRMDAAR